MSLKKLVWRVMPVATHRLLRDVYFTLRLAPNYLYDFRRFLKYSGLNRSRGLYTERAARIVLAYHQLEKGLSLAEPRPGFGKDVVSRLLLALDNFVPHHGCVAPATVGVGVLQAYITFNEQAGIDVGWVRARLDKLLCDVAPDRVECEAAGTLHMSRDELALRRESGFRGLFESRFSVRQFSGGEIPEAHLRDAVSIAQKTPSVCNRQAWRVHAISRPDEMARVMAIQGGSRGFGEKASMVLLVSCDLGFFVEPGERYQAWIDGGMFSMSLCLALHSMGYGTCCLAWSKERATDMALRSATTLPDGEQVIMLMAVGTLPASFQVAASARRSLDEVLVMHR